MIMIVMSVRSRFPSYVHWHRAGSGNACLAGGCEGHGAGDFQAVGFLAGDCTSLSEEGFLTSGMPATAL